MSYEYVLTEISRVLPRVNLDPLQAAAVLTEITERSGLLVSLDNGERYRFAHLTVQEFFAASELMGRPDDMLQRFSSDPDAWREPIRLLCGGSADSTDVVRQLSETDPVLALECLADATRIDEEFAVATIERFKPLFESAVPSDPIVPAFGLLAADSGARGQAVFDYLVRGTEVPQLRSSMAASLAASNVARAADVISELVREDSSMVPVLESMGNLAISALEGAAMAGDPSAIRGLDAIATPWAAQALGRLVLRTMGPERHLAALSLSGLIAEPAIEEALGGLELVDGHGGEFDGWLWLPFEGRHSPVEDRVLARLFAVLFQELAAMTSDDHLSRPADPRLVAASNLFHASGVPQACVSLEGAELDSDLARAIEDRLRTNLFSTSSRSGFPLERAVLADPTDFSWDELAAILDACIAAMVRTGQRSPQIAHLLTTTDAIVASHIVSNGMVAPGTSRRRWAEMSRTDVFEMDGSWYHRIAFFTVVVGVAGMVLLWNYGHYDGRGLAGSVNAVAIAGLVAGLAFLVLVPWQESAFLEPWSESDDLGTIRWLSPIIGPVLIVDADSLGEFTGGVAITLFAPGWFYLAALTLSEPLGGMPLAMVAVAAIECALITIHVLGSRRDQRARNPLRFLFEALDSSKAGSPAMALTTT